MSKVKELVKKRGVFKGKMTNFSTYLSSVKESDQLSKLESRIELDLRLKRIESLFDDFDTLQSEMEELSDSPEEQVKERDMCEAQYFSLISSARAMLETYKNAEQAEVSFCNASASHAQNFVRLPKINLPTFNGNYQHWLEFRDTFLSLIHTNDKIDNINKFHYLRASLQDGAALVVKSFDFRADNYLSAWQLICERYDNKHLLVNNHVHALFAVQPITKESSKALRYIVDITNKNLRALSTLNEPIEHWDTLIIYLMNSKLDSTTSREWEERRSSSDDSAKLSLFIKFLSNKADILETLEESQSQGKSNTHQAKASKSFLASTSKAADTKTKSSCGLCHKPHSLFSCKEFRKLPVNMRIQKAKECKVCFNCLHSGHAERTCKFGNCKYCSQRHNTLLHSDCSNEPAAIEAIALSTNTFKERSNVHVLLSTALVKVRDNKGKPHVARVLLDNGSTANFVSQDLCRKLGLPSSFNSSKVTGISGLTSQSTRSCSITIESINSNYKTNITCFVLPTISSSIPSTHIDIHDVQIPSGICLADPKYYTPASTDILIGADIFWDIIGTNRIQLGKNQPTLVESTLGWLVSGSIYDGKASTVMSHLCQDTPVELSKFWELDTIPPEHDFTADEKACELHFTKTTKRNSQGRFIVSMPLKESPSALGDSFQVAKRRFLSIERRLERDMRLKNLYTEFITEYINLGHMSETTFNSEKKISCFLPHHGVLRESSITTKLRVVFDASAVTSSGKSLNDIQRVGPTVQDNLLSILIRFRQHKFVITADIEKMYRQIEVDPTQRSLQQILWRSDPSHPLKVYTLNTITYGTASAPFLATRCLRQLGLEATNEEVKRAICHDFYVDDLLTGHESYQDAVDLCQGIINSLESAKLCLRKWNSNCTEILNAISKGDSTHHLVDLSENELSKTLGLNWNSAADCLTFSIHIEGSDKISKRHILSTIAQVFDPLGIVAPCIISAKIIMQQLWKDQCSWDEDVPQHIKKEWLSFVHTLSHLNKLNIPRCIIVNSPINVQLHTFTDASESAYGACVYVRCVGGDGAVTVRLLVSKSKVAPIKPTTIPRLELCAALLGTRLWKRVIASVTFKYDDCFFWSDSTITLGWLAHKSEQCKPFVRHRVSEIQEDSSGFTWRYVTSKENPADLVSRGVSADQLGSNSIWWSGPNYLKGDMSQWPSVPGRNCNSELPELISLHTTCNTKPAEINLVSTLISTFSNFTSLQRVIAYLFRFINNCRQSKRYGCLTTSELNKSVTFLLGIAQQESFPTEKQCLLSNVKLPHKNRLLSVSPFMDANNIIRIGGRLGNSNYEYNVRHPILLCSRHPLTKLLFEMLHKTHIHPGPRLLLALVRTNYWVIGGTALAKRTVRTCVKCCRFKAQTIQPVMGNLPEQRVELEFPFLNTGVDYAGPMMISDRKGRGSRLVKSYICIFVCLASKAVHLELVSDLTKEAFIAALNRFIGRRGKPQHIFSDNGTTFVGTFNELSKLLHLTLPSQVAEQGIQFSFIPAYTPHFGGLWESAVKSVKHHLRRILSLAHLTFEEMSTLLIQIEAILNSRPLTPMSDDPSDLYPLTPSHFLIGRSLIFVPHPQITEAKITSLQRFQRVEYLKQHFWNRFSNEYITLLQQKTKWHTSYGDLKPGDLVVLKEKALPPLMWLLGRIERVLPGKDGVARVADIKTKKGIIRRAYNTICPLPVQGVEGTSTGGV